MAKMSTNTDNQLQLEVDINGSGNKSYLLSTQGKYLENDIKFKTSTPAVGAASLSITDSSTDVTIGTAADGKYPLSASLTGAMTFASAGWIGTGGASATDSTVQVGKIAQSNLKNGSADISSGATINPTSSTQTINIAAGYEAARTVKVGPVSAGPKGTVTSGAATLGTLTYTNNTTSGKFDISGTATIASPTVNTAGYVSSDAGTKNSNSNTVTQTVNKITVGTEITSGTDGKVQPVISRTAKPSGDTWTDAANGAETGTKPTSGVYVRVDAPAIDKTVSVQGIVTSDGYGTTDAHTKATAQSLTLGSSAAATKYVPIKSAATPSITTTDLSGTDVVTVGTLSSGYYPINATNVTASAKIGIGTAGWYSGSGSTSYSSKLTTSKQVGKMARAAASVAASVAAPTVTNHTADVSGKTQILSDVVPDTSSSNIGTYYISVKGVSGAVTQGAPSIGTSGYLTEAAQITATGVDAGNQTSTYYIPVPTAAVSVSASKAATTPTISKVTTAVSGATNITGDLSGTAPSSGYFISVSANAPATTLTITKSVGAAGYITSQDQITASAATTATGSGTKYMTIPTAAFTVSGNKVYCSTAGYTPTGTTATPIGTVGTGTIENNVSSLPSGASSTADINRGKYIKIGAGYYGEDKYYRATPTSGTFTVASSGNNQNIESYTYLNVPAGAFTNNASGTATTTVNRGSKFKIAKGWYNSDSIIAAQANSGTIEITSSGNTSVDGKVTATVAAASFGSAPASGKTNSDYADYDEYAPVLESNSYLYINAGYTPARRISLAKLVPNEADVGAAETSDNILTGHSAYNIDGKIVSGSMAIYDGTYTVT